MGGTPRDFVVRLTRAQMRALVIACEETKRLRPTLRKPLTGGSLRIQRGMVLADTTQRRERTVMRISSVRASLERARRCVERGIAAATEAQEKIGRSMP